MGSFSLAREFYVLVAAHAPEPARGFEPHIPEKYFLKVKSAHVHFK
jgi:hypothetical protein